MRATLTYGYATGTSPMSQCRRVDIAATNTEQLRGSRPGRHPQRHQRTVAVRAELRRRPG
jgi:hypothetical protein